MQDNAQETRYGTKSDLAEVANDLYKRSKDKVMGKWNMCVKKARKLAK